MGSNWYVVRANIKCEDKAERNLRMIGFETYAPWQKFERYNRRKNVHIVHTLRLCPRYIFLNVGDLARERTPWGLIRSCDGVESLLGVNGLPMPLSASERAALELIMEAEREHVFDETRDGKLYRREIGKTKKETTRMKFPVGSKVRINEGPFATFSGEVTNVNGRGHLMVLAKIFGRMVPVELEASHVQAA